MIHPAGDKVIALSIVAHEALFQGALVRFIDNGDGRLGAFKVAATTDISNFGAYMAYWISPDSEDVEYVGAPQSTTFTLNTDTGVGGGTHTIASGTECVALGGSKVALIRIDANSLYGTPSDLTSYTPGLVVKAHTDGYLALDADDDLNVASALVVQNDTASIVVLLA
jgi:hypothetical protein